MRSVPESASRRRIGLRLAEALGVVLVCLLAAEASLRLFNHYSPSFVFESASLHRFRGRPHAPNYDGRLNSRGFNDLEWAPASTTMAMD